MTEQEWASCSDPERMLAFLRDNGRANPRKLRLFIAACARLFWDKMTNPELREVVETAERYADGLASFSELNRTHCAVTPHSPGNPWEEEEGGIFFLSFSCGYTDRGLDMLERMGGWKHAGYLTGQHQPTVLREVFSNPFRPVVLDPAWLAWNGRTVEKLALAAYEERQLPSGHLEPHRLGILADGLEEAGCADGELLGHLRGPGPHVRGCHVVDLLLGRP